MYLAIDTSTDSAGLALIENGLMLAEALSYALAKTSMSKASANQLVKEACQVVVKENRHLVDVVQEKTDVLVDWKALREESAYLGSSDIFINRVLQAVTDGQEGTVE